MIRLVPIIILFLTFAAFSQPLKVRSAGNGKAKITIGKSRSIINLSEAIAGCLMTYDGSDPESKKYDATSFDLIDSVKKDGSIYVVLLATAGGNCNVQGHCGAAESYTLFWLKLNNSLKLQKKNSVVVQNCLDDLNLTEDSEIKLNQGVLKIQFEDNLDQENLDYTITRLIYKHREAEKGFIVKTKKRDRPQS